MLFGQPGDRVGSMTKDEQFNARLEQLRTYVATHGHANPPISYLDQHTGFALGKWVSSVRYSYRNNALSNAQAAALETVPAWHWEKRLRGRPAKAERNQQIYSMHAEGVMVSVLAERFGITTQRVHQILALMKAKNP